MNHSPTTATTSTVSVGSRVENLRAARRVSVTSLALALGVHRSTMYAKLAGTRPWDSDEIAAAARLFDVTADHLLGLDDGLEP